MNGKNILIGLSYIDRKYIEESEEDMRPEKVVRNSKRMPGRKIWLIAAVIAMLLMLVGCGVAYALHLQSLKIGEETYTQNMRYEKDGSTIPPPRRSSSTFPWRGRREAKTSSPLRSGWISSRATILTSLY